jgi:hypothetical protein
MKHSIERIIRDTQSEVRELVGKWGIAYMSCDDDKYKEYLDAIINKTIEIKALKRRLKVIKAFTFWKKLFKDLLKK